MAAVIATIFLSILANFVKKPPKILLKDGIWLFMACFSPVFGLNLATACKESDDLEAVEILRSEIAAAGRSIEEREGQVAAVTEDYARDRDRFAQLQDVVLLRRSLSRDRASRDN
mgnify:CR=1 FL=1